MTLPFNFLSRIQLDKHVFYNLVIKEVVIEPLIGHENSHLTNTLSF